MSPNAEVIPFYGDSFDFPNTIMDVPDNAASSSQTGRNSPEQVPVDIKVLPTTFVPGEWDVICQRGRQNYYHIGTRRFRSCVNNHLHSYVAAKTKKDKSMVVTTIVDLFRENMQPAGGGFIRKDLLNNRWYEVAEKIAREKVGQALRDAINQEERQKESGETEEGSNRSFRKRCRVTGEDDYEDRRLSPALDFVASLQQQDGVTANPTSGVGITPLTDQSSMFFQNQQDVGTMMAPPPLHFGVGSVRRDTAVRMEAVFSKMMATAARGAGTSSSSISTSKNFQSPDPPWSKLEDRHQGALPPVTHYDDNHLMPQWSLADLEPRPLRPPPSPSFASNKERNDLKN